jgi:hypothetical protein
MDSRDGRWLDSQRFPMDASLPWRTPEVLGNLSTLSPVKLWTDDYCNLLRVAKKMMSARSPRPLLAYNLRSFDPREDVYV